MKRTISLIIAVAMLLTTAFVVPTATHSNDVCAKSKSKYVKIKKTTWKEYKEAYTVTLPNYKKKVTSLNKTVASQKKTITARNNTIKNKDATIASQKKTIDAQAAQITEKDATIKDKKSTISWLWDQLEAFGYFYNYDSHKWEPKEQESEPIEVLDLDNAPDVAFLIEEQTDLHVDSVAIIDSWKTWYCYYVQADGDLYVITVKNEEVQVCTMLN